MKILFYHPNYIYNLDTINDFKLFKYDDINFNNITISELIYNDKFKYINIYYNNLKFVIKTPFINIYFIEKFNDYYLFKFNKSYVDFLYNLEKYIIKKSIKQLSNWYSNYKFFYSSIINSDSDLIEIKIYNNIPLSNNFSFDNIYLDFINNIYHNLSLHFQLYGLWIYNNNDNDNNMYIGLFNKSLFIDI